MYIWVCVYIYVCACGVCYEEKFGTNQIFILIVFLNLNIYVRKQLFTISLIVDFFP